MHAERREKTQQKYELLNKSLGEKKRYQKQKRMRKVLKHKRETHFDQIKGVCGVWINCREEKWKQAKM